MSWWNRTAPAEPSAPRQSWWGRLVGKAPATPQATMSAQVRDAAMAKLPVPGIGMDSADCGGLKNGLSLMRGDAALAGNEGIMGFFAGHSLPLPYFQCAQLMTHWLIDKACRMPARDAVRQGYVLNANDDEALEKRIRAADKRMRLDRHMEQFVHLGRGFGIRILMFRVESSAAATDAYYAAPFNPDGVTPGSYKGIVQVDPYWCEPELDQVDMMDPLAPGFYEPTYWRIGNRRIHRSHLIIFRNGELADHLKPLYRYGGVSVPQRIAERVYAAERVANEAPELVMTKRTTVVGMDLGEAEMAWDRVHANLDQWVRTRNNYGVKVKDAEDTVEQFDTSLSDLDAVTMNGYQLVAAAANVPATKLLGTTPKGFNSTGESEEANYHEELESIQSHDLDPLMGRHYLLLMRSWGLPKVTVEHTWLPLDTPTAAEYATMELTKAQRDVALQTAGAIDRDDIRARLAKERDGDYFGIELDLLPDLDDLTDASGTGNTGIS